MTIVGAGVTGLTAAIEAAERGWRVTIARAPMQESFRAWLLRHTEARFAEAIIGLVFIATFDHDPGRLSAAFARERLRRVLAGEARYVAGGWSVLVGLLAERAASLGVRI